MANHPEKDLAKNETSQDINAPAPLGWTKKSHSLRRGLKKSSEKDIVGRLT
jgi:hypothetical protein